MVVIQYVKDPRPSNPVVLETIFANDEALAEQKARAGFQSACDRLGAGGWRLLNGVTARPIGIWAPECDNA